MMNNEKNSPQMYDEVDKLIHEPARFNIMALLYVIKRAEYLFVLNQTNMTSGNLSTHAAKLEKAGYLLIEKKFIRKKPKTFLRLTSQGRKAFESYRNSMNKMFTASTKSDENSLNNNNQD